MTTVVCLGNDMRGDDGAGPAVAERLRARGVPAVIEAPENLIHLFEECDDVVVVDAIATGAPPGTIHRLDAADPLPDFSGASTHLFGLSDAVELARTLGRLPGSLRIIGIEAGAFAHGAALSPPVDLAAERVADELALAR